MIAKFHSAPDRSMETTLTISLPPVQSVRTSRAEREREKEREREWEKDQTREREKREKKERKKEEQVEREREKELETERERDRETEMLVRDQERAKVHSERNVSYKDKFQKMREKYDKVTATHEAHERDLEILNAKMKKLQAENDLLLDAMFLADSGLYDRYFPTRPGSTSPTFGPTSSSVLGLQIPPPLASARSQGHTPRSAHFSVADHLGPPPQPPQPSSMAPPPPPVSAATSTASGSTATGGPLRSIPSMTSSAMPPPTSGTNSNGITINASTSSAAMPPPVSAVSSNGTFGGSSTPGRSTRRTSMSSSRSRRRSDASLASVQLAPEDLGDDGVIATATDLNGGGDRRTPTPTVAAAPPEDEPFRSPRVNGSASATSPLIGMPNGVSLGARSRPETSREDTPVGDTSHPSPHNDDDQDMDGPAVPEPNAGDGGEVVHSPTDGEDDEDDDARVDEEEDVDVENMDVDDEDDATHASRLGTGTPRRGLGSLRRGGRG